MGVVAEAYDRGEPANDLWLHVRGGEIDRRIRVGEPKDDVFLSAEPRDTYEYYFVQLTDSQWKPVSLVHSIRTFGNDANGGCSRNMIGLTFVRERKDSGAPPRN